MTFKSVSLYSIALTALFSKATSHASAQTLVLASTTSTEQSGLFSHLLPAFKAASGIDIKVVALGTGHAATKVVPIPLSCVFGV
jgi:tungstate transport system substrate-binding protein